MKKYEINNYAVIKGFITNLGKYNEGELVGMWISFPVFDEELEAIFQTIGINEEYEEFFFTDWECELDFDFGEYSSIDKVNEIAERINELDEYEWETMEAYMEALGGDAEEALDNIDNCTFWNGYSLSEVAEELAEECGDLVNVPDWIAYHIDWEAVGNELSYDGYYETSNGVIRCD